MQAAVAVSQGGKSDWLETQVRKADWQTGDNYVLLVSGAVLDRETPPYSLSWKQAVTGVIALVQQEQSI